MRQQFFSTTSHQRTRSGTSTVPRKSRQIGKRREWFFARFSSLARTDSTRTLINIARRRVREPAIQSVLHLPTPKGGDAEIAGSVNAGRENDATDRTGI